MHASSLLLIMGSIHFPTASSRANLEDCAHEFRYYKALSLMETRFPISQENGHVQIYFPWTDAVQTKKMTRQMNIHFEKAAVAFNIAAMLSQQAASKNKNTAEGCKDSAQLFQVICHGRPCKFLWRQCLICNLWCALNVLGSIWCFPKGWGCCDKGATIVWSVLWYST